MTDVTAGLVKWVLKNLGFKVKNVKNLKSEF